MVFPTVFTSKLFVDSLGVQFRVHGPDLVDALRVLFYFTILRTLIADNHRGLSRYNPLQLSSKPKSLVLDTTKTPKEPILTTTERVVCAHEIPYHEAS